MAEPTVQVPVSLIEALRAAHGGPDLDAAAGAVIELLPDSYTNALLSQPTPTAESAFVRQMRPAPESSRVRWEMWCPACGIEEFMADDADDARLVAHVAEHNAWHAEPPRIEDMAPVATHSSGEHRRVRLGQGDDLPVCDTCTNVLGLNVRWDHAVQRHEREGIDPSTIHDVQPPAQ